jgi:hypothetical protein
MSNYKMIKKTTEKEKHGVFVRNPLFTSVKLQGAVLSASTPWLFFYPANTGNIRLLWTPQTDGLCGKKIQADSAPNRFTRKLAMLRCRVCSAWQIFFRKPSTHRSPDA